MNRDAVRELADRYEEFRCLRAPAYRDVARRLQDTIIDLFQEAAYVVGLADTFLGKRRLGHGRMKVDEILLDPTIDERLQCARPASDKDREILEQFKKYRESMLNLARALERATGVPIHSKQAA
ncbi:MAG: hypothetical protein HY689_12300 [Chloroflexi bacterium]|nr:hypothetical protein [Chloroflexota bacterium]